MTIFQGVVAYLHVKCLVRTKSLISADFDPKSLFGDYFPRGWCSGCCIFTRKMPCTDKIFDFSRFRSKILIWGLFSRGGGSGCCIFTRKMPCTDEIFLISADFDPKSVFRNYFPGGGVRVAAYLDVKCLVRTKSLISADFDPKSLFGDYFPGGGCSGCCIFARKMPCTDKIFDFSRFPSKILIW